MAYIEMEVPDKSFNDDPESWINIVSDEMLDAAQEAVTDVYRLDALKIIASALSAIDS